MKQNQYFIFSIVTILTLVSSVHAADADSVNNEIVVTGQKKSYQSTLSSGLKTTAPLLDTPQAVSVITKLQLEDQAIQDIADITRYTPGLSISQGEGHRDAIVIRGLRSTADFFVDGIRDDTQYFRPLYNLERVEIHKGPNALVFGRGSGAGNINRVTKTAQLNDQFVNVNSTANTFGAYQLSADANTSIGENIAFRINMLGEQFRNHRDFYEGERYAFNPTLSAKLSANTLAQFSYEYIDDDRVVDRGVPALPGGSRANPANPVSGFRDTFFGSPNANQTTLQAHSIRTRLFHDFNTNHRVNATLHYANYDKLYQNLFPIASDLANNSVSLDGYSDTTQRENFIAQLNFISNMMTGTMEHELLYGFEYSDQQTKNARRDVLFADSNDDRITFNFTNPLTIPTFSFPSINRNRDSDVTVASIYLQDQIKITDYFQIIAGARYDQFDIDVRDIFNNTDLGRVDKNLSPRLGLVLKPKDNISIYASYSESFLPRSGEQFLTLSANTANLAPQIYENYELGLKWNVLESLSFSSAIFRLNVNNDATVDPNDPQNSLRIDSKIEGLELQLLGHVTQKWQVNAGYSYLNGRETGRLVNAVEDNRLLPEIPKHMFSMWNRYDFTKQLGLGLGVIHQTEQFASIGNTVELPAFTRVDAAAYYTVNDNLSLQLNVENLFDEDYFPASHNDNNISTGEPLNASLSARITF